MRNRGHCLFFAETKEPGHYGRGGKLDEDSVVHAVGVEGVLDLETALDLVCFDHGCENSVHGKWRTVMNQPAAGGGPTEPVRHGENGTQVVFDSNPADQRPRTSNSERRDSIPEGCDASAPPRASLWSEYRIIDPRSNARFTGSS